MYIRKIDYDKKEIVCSDYYPKEVIILEEDAVTGLLRPSFMRVTKSVPTPGTSLKIDVAQNGYVVSCGKSVKVVEGDYDSDLQKAISSFANKDVESERELTETELADEDLIEALSDMNSKATV